MDCETTWLYAGTTWNHVYITWNDPNLPHYDPATDSTTDLWETLLAIGCGAADGTGGTVGTDDMTALDTIWDNGIEGRSVKRVDGTPLHYYDPWVTNVVTTHDLLTTGDGQCGSWASLFIDVLKAQGIYTDYSNATSPTYYHDYVFVKPASGYADGFIVKNWTFSGPGISGVPGFPYLNIPAGNPLDPVALNNYQWLYSQVRDQWGVPGQNNSNPRSLFRNHQIVRVVAKDVLGQRRGEVLRSVVRPDVHKPQRHGTSGHRRILQVSWLAVSVRVRR